MTVVLTLVGPPGAVTPTLAARMAETLGGSKPDVLSPGEAVAFILEAEPDASGVRNVIAGSRVDAIVTPAHDRRKRVLVADMDSTIVTSETLDDLAALAGVGERVAAITRRAMNGDIDFSQALRERVALLEGLPVAALETAWGAIGFTEGARELIATARAHGVVTALVSGGFTWFTGRVAGALGFDHHHANLLLDDGSILLGRVQEPIFDPAAKLATLHALARAESVSVQDCLAVGDGANDLPMVQAAGLGVAFRAKPILANAAKVRVQHSGLRALLFIQGYRLTDIVSQPVA